VTAPRTATARQRRGSYPENMLTGFNALAELYYTYWGEFFHLAVFDPGDDPDRRGYRLPANPRALPAGHRRDRGRPDPRGGLRRRCPLGMAGGPYRRAGARRRPVGQSTGPCTAPARRRATTEPAVRPAGRHAPLRPLRTAVRRCHLPRRRLLPTGPGGGAARDRNQAATRRPCPNRSGSACCCAWPPTASSTARWPSRQPKTSSRSPYSPKRRPSRAYCVTSPSSPNATTDRPAGCWGDAGGRARRRRHPRSRLAEAADVIADHPIALQLRNLQVLGEIAVEKNSTIVFPAQFPDSARELARFVGTEESATAHPALTP
jgi:hypothetical protein